MPIGSLTGAARPVLGRHAGTLAARALDEVVLPSSATVVAKALSRDLVAAGVDPYHEPEVHGAVIGKRMLNVLDPHIRRTFDALADSGRPDALLVKNAPLDDLVPPGRSIGERLARKTRVSESGLAALTFLMRCKLQKIAREHGGLPIHNLSPIAGKEASESSISLNAFRLHTDDPCEQRPCDFVVLYGLEGDRTARTTFLPIREIVSGLDPDVRREFEAPNFTFRSGGSATQVERGTHPVVQRDATTGEVRFRMYESQQMKRVTAHSAAAQRALDRLDARISTVLAQKTGTLPSVNLKPGEALILNNGWSLDGRGGVMHGRASTIENPGRWLQRGLAERAD